MLTTECSPVRTLHAQEEAHFAKRVYPVFGMWCGISQTNYAGFTLVRLLDEARQFSCG